MKIDISRVNLLEKDIEDWLYANPLALNPTYVDNPIVNWLGRQYQLPSGIADLIGVRQDKMLVVVEIKNVPINKAAVLQVCRYTSDLKRIVSSRMEYPHFRDNHEPVIEMVLVGPSVDDQTFTEARAVNVDVFTFTANLTLTIGELAWNREHYTRLNEQHEQISARPEWGIFGLTTQEDYEQYLDGASESQDPDSYSDIILGDGTVILASDIKKDAGDIDT